ncbi:DUF664 domain-containing protein [Xylanimonas sp. McL0601]|uniref:mycothiol transferase n=1 Tax=Xylanimonas sp. McL0601 TaxID=3414739 RepID=UPI003CF33A56
MSDSTLPPWEPPLAGTETEHIFGSLDRLRATFRWKVDGLDATAMHARIPSSSLSLGGLLKHLAVQEDYAAAVKIAGGSLPPDWDDNGWDGDDDWEFTSGCQDPPESLYALYDRAVARSRALVRQVVADRGLGGDSGVTLGDGTRASIRRVLFDLLEEYGRHTGHADLIREAVDGRVGEDPPADWHPVGSPLRPRS